MPSAGNAGTPLIDPLQCDHAVEGVECMSACNAPKKNQRLQCDHAVEGVECEENALLGQERMSLQCDHAVEGVECGSRDPLAVETRWASM